MNDHGRATIVILRKIADMIENGDIETFGVESGQNWKSEFSGDATCDLVKFVFSVSVCISCGPDDETRLRLVQP